MGMGVDTGINTNVINARIAGLMYTCPHARAGACPLAENAERVQTIGPNGIGVEPPVGAVVNDVKDEGGRYTSEVYSFDLGSGSGIPIR